MTRVSKVRANKISEAEIFPTTTETRPTGVHAAPPSTASPALTSQQCPLVHTTSILNTQHNTELIELSIVCTF